MIYFTSDTHFGSARTLELSRRPFSSVEEMDHALVVNWNKKVTDDDVVYHLGDFGDREYASLLNGRIIFLPGNYERDEFQTVDRMEEELHSTFDTVVTTSRIEVPLAVLCGMANDSKLRKYIEECSEITGREISLVTSLIYMMHEPSRHVNISTCLNLYGHIHGRQMVRRYGMDVGVDAHHFYPVSLEDVIFYWTAILKYYDKEVFN